MKDKEDRKYQLLQHSQSVVPLVLQPTTVEFRLDPCWMPFCDEHSQKLFTNGELVKLNLQESKHQATLLRQQMLIIRQKNPPSLYLGIRKSARSATATKYN